MGESTDDSSTGKRLRSMMYREAVIIGAVIVDQDLSPRSRFTLKTVYSTARFAGSAILLILAGLLAGCVTTTPFEEPAPYDRTVLKNRAKSTEDEGIRVSATMVDQNEARVIFGVDLVASQIQPVWFEIENRSDRQVIFFPTGLDPEYYSPLEVSFRYHRKYNRDSRAKINDAIQSLGLEYTIEPQSTESGFVFTNMELGSKFLTVDLVSDSWAKSYFLVLPVPDASLAGKLHEDLLRRSQGDGTIEVDDESRLRELLEELPCCASDQNGTPGEPLNLIFVGDLDATVTAMIRRRNRSSSLAPLYVFGRPQDFSASKQDHWVPSQPHRIRSWLTGIRFQGHPVWIAQASMPLGGRFGKKSDGLVQLPIDPYVDAVRNGIVQDLIYSQFVSRIAFIKGVGPAASEEPRSTPSGGLYHTDGLRAVLFFDPEPVSLAELQFLDWEKLAPDLD